MAKRTLLTEIYNSVPTIPYEGNDEQIHTDEHPYCDDPTCPCNANVVDASTASCDREAAQERNATTQCADGSWW